MSLYLVSTDGFPPLFFPSLSVCSAHRQASRLSVGLLGRGLCEEAEEVCECDDGHGLSLPIQDVHSVNRVLHQSVQDLLQSALLLHRHQRPGRHHIAPLPREVGRARAFALEKVGLRCRTADSVDCQREETRRVEEKREVVLVAAEADVGGRQVADEFSVLVHQPDGGLLVLCHEPEGLQGTRRHAGSEHGVVCEFDLVDGLREDL
mmetsp:Transcript_44284/g.87405  ORF Transcript_44284/g.87405 Transcript_44284/m.87405 type:complete len:206 (-) Transcript_44284:734-1351(-)